MIQLLPRSEHIITNIGIDKLIFILLRIFGFTASRQIESLLDRFTETNMNPNSALIFIVVLPFKQLIVN